MKHLFNATLLLLALLLPANATAHDFEVDGIYYSIMSYTTVKVSGYNSSILDGNIVIPDYVINNYMEYDVVAIADSAFYGSDISSVRISEYITAIGDKAFYGCNNLNDVYSSIANPSKISMGFDVFSLDNLNYSNRMLHVPVGSVELYQADTNWKSFFYVILDNNNLTSDNIIFWVDNIQYTITSNTTVKASLYDVWWYGLESYIIEVPGHISFNDIVFTVTEIGDSAFFRDDYISLQTHYFDDDYTNYLYCNYRIDITIPETVTSIGYNAFGGKDINLINITCLAETPPIMNNSFISSGYINLFVPSEYYSQYLELNNDSHIFDSIYITNGEQSSPPDYIENDLTQSDGSIYGSSVIIYPSENSVVYARDVYNSRKNVQFDLISAGEWNRFNHSDTINFFYEAIYNHDYRLRPNGWMIEFFVVEDGKKPSTTIRCGHIEGYTDYKWYRSYDFIDSGIYYNGRDDNAEVTFCGYIFPIDYKKAPQNRELSNNSNLNSFYPYDSDYYPYDEFDIIDHYAGDIVIPTTVTYNKLDGTSTNYHVNSIGDYAFKGSSITSIEIPPSITYVGMGAFDSCYDLTRVNITDLPSWCNIVFYVDYTDGPSNPLEYAHRLYLNGLEVTDLVIPDTISHINELVFRGCTGLTSVTMPSTITSIGYGAFAKCTNLNYIKCLGATPPSAEYDTFDEGVYQNTTLYVPLNAIEAYRNAEVWGNFQNIVGFVDYDFEVDGIYYSMTSDQEAVVVHGEEAYQGNVVIPGTVTYEGNTYTVTGIGSGAFANATVNCLSLPVDVINNIASDAFVGSNIQSVYITGNGAWTAGALPSNVENLYIGSGVTAVPGLQVNPTTIYSYATVPPTCDENSFTGYDAALHVPASSLASYFTAPYWSNFINIVGDAIEPTAVTLDNDSISILIGNQVQLTATIEPENATPNQILWTSSDSSVATVVDGMIQAVAVGECDIKAWLLDKSAVCHVTVTEIAPTEVTLNQTFAKLEIGSQLSLTATVLPDDATDKVITWTTSNSAVATVDSLGNVIAVGPGECSITASCRDKQATCHVIVVEHLIFITLDQHELSVLPNHIEMLTPSVSPVSTDLRVTSSDPAVAAARLANGKIQVVGITEGTTTITIGSVDGYAEPDSCVVTVYTERGDVNNDGYVNITDAIDLINDILNDASASFYTVNADCNNDGEVNISDVMRLINYILSGAELEPKETTDPTQAETETITVNGVSFTMVKVDGGSFMMGCTPEQNSEAGSNEAPVHRVTLSTYYMGQTEVTQELWQAVMGSNPSNFANDAQNPVEKVTWNDCQEFISQLNQLTGKTFRLPTEAEWEFAACGGNKSHGYTYSGSNDINEIAWFSDNSENTTHPVGLKKANELGLFDMTGNVYEWCYDRYGYYPEAPQTDPQGPETGSSKIYRGGGWMSAATSCRNTRRNFFAPGVVRNFMGLRLVMVP